MSFFFPKMQQLLLGVIGGKGLGFAWVAKNLNLLKSTSAGDVVQHMAFVFGPAREGDLNGFFPLRIHGSILLLRLLCLRLFSFFHAIGKRVKRWTFTFFVMIDIIFPRAD